MHENPSQPRAYDAVLGNQASPPVDGAVLGGLPGVKRRFASGSVQQKVAVLCEALNYGQAGLDLLIEALIDDAEPVRRTALLLLLDLRKLPQVKQALEDFRYQPLRQLLATRKWKEADQETTSLMLQIGNRTKAGYLRLEDIAAFPCSDLCTLNTLWAEYSEGCFGFGVQSYIWQAIGGTSNPDWDAWCRFGKCVGWYVEESWLWWNDLTFSLNAPIGHLPRGGAYIGWGLGDFWTGCRMLCALTSKLVQCDRS